VDESAYAATAAVPLTVTEPTAVSRLGNVDVNFRINLRNEAEETYISPHPHYPVNIFHIL